MARPQKYDWGKIKSAYESGMHKDEICGAYSIPRKNLDEKISRDKWRVLQDINSDIIGLSDSFAKIKHTILQNPELTGAIQERVSTILKDNKIVINNRDLGLLLQMNMVTAMESGAYAKPSEIKTGASTLVDLEKISNPKPDVQVNTQNIIQPIFDITAIKNKLK